MYIPKIWIFDGFWLSDDRFELRADVVALVNNTFSCKKWEWSDPSEGS